MSERDKGECEMSDVRDPKIRLFGKIIGLPETAMAAENGGRNVSVPCLDSAGEDGSNQEPACWSDSVVGNDSLNRDAEEGESCENLSTSKQDDAKEEFGVNLLTSDESKDSSNSQAITQDPNLSSENEAGSEKMIKNEDDRNGETTLKKSDKIIPCPRCNSMETKFCYFNNYNVNQPRHFCKNCLRYWTAGGTMRNVPVGAGRRKNKNSISQYRNLTESARVDLPDGILNPDGAVLTFGSDSYSPLCESMASVLNIVDKSHCNSLRNGEISVSDRSKESGDDSSCRSSTMASTSKDEKKGLPEMVPCYGGGPLPYPWNPMQWNSSLPPPAFTPPIFPMPFFSAAPPPYWGWNVPWVMQRAPLSSGPNSPTLGESAKSSIWATLGIKNERIEGVGGGGGIFKAFQTQSKGDEKSHVSATCTVLEANPVAFSRSLSFHENSLVEIICSA